MAPTWKHRVHVRAYTHEGAYLREAHRTRARIWRASRAREFNSLASVHRDILALFQIARVCASGPFGITDVGGLRVVRGEFRVFRLYANRAQNCVRATGPPPRGGESSGLCAGSRSSLSLSLPLCLPS